MTSDHLWGAMQWPELDRNDARSYSSAGLSQYYYYSFCYCCDIKENHNGSDPSGFRQRTPKNGRPAEHPGLVLAGSKVLELRKHARLAQHQ